MSEQKKKIKIVTIGDHPLTPSGVGLQSRYIIEGLLKTGDYTVRSLGGALKHQDYRIQRIQEYGEDWYIYPIEGYGNPQILREIMDTEKPDAFWVMTDPRFYIWLFEMSDELRDRDIPLLYYHVWDEAPSPKFNKPYYDSCDFVGCISELTYNILKDLGHKNFKYIPHAIDENVFKPLSEEERQKAREETFKDGRKDKFVMYYCSRNARRKMTSDTIRFFKMMIDKIGKDKAFLLMKCNPGDAEGSNLYEVCNVFGLGPKQIAFTDEKVPPQQMAIFYNIADVTVCISNAEGFGLSSLESLMCGTPVISTRTGGLQDQNYNKETEEEYGVSIYPKTKSLTGSQQIPYIFECRCTDEDILQAYLKMYNMSNEERRKLGLRGYEYVKSKFKLENMINDWDSAIRNEVKKAKESGIRDRVKLLKVS